MTYYADNITTYQSLSLYTASNVVLNSLTVSNVTCVFCAKFLMNFVSNTIQMADLTFENIGNNNQVQQESKGRSNIKKNNFKILIS